MRRREFIVLIGGVVLAGAAIWPLTPHAQQQSAMPLIGYLSARSPNDTSRLQAFHLGLSENGIVEGQNAKIDYRIRRRNKSFRETQEIYP